MPGYRKKFQFVAGPVVLQNAGSLAFRESACLGDDRFKKWVEIERSTEVARDFEESFEANHPLAIHRQ